MGCGVLLLLLSRLAATMRLGVGVEIQESLCAFAEGNFGRTDSTGDFSR